MVAVSPEIDDDDLRVREGLLDQALDFNSVHGHRDALQSSVASIMQAPNQLTRHASRAAGLRGSHREAATDSDFAGFVAGRRAFGVGFATSGTRHVGDATCFADSLPSRPDSVDLSSIPRAARLLLPGPDVTAGAARKCESPISIDLP